MPITKMHFVNTQSAADIINNIRQGNWTNEPPDWCRGTLLGESAAPRYFGATDDSMSLARAVWTA